MQHKNLFVLVAVVGMTACQGWQQMPRPAAGGNIEGNPAEVRVTRTLGCGPAPSRACMENRGTVTVFNARIQGDSLIGYYDRDNRERVAIALEDVHNVESRKVDKVRTTGAVLGGAAITAAAVVVLGVLLLFAAID